jgi:hypothetical protein
MREGEVIRNPEAETAGIDSQILEGRDLERRNPEERREISRGACLGRERRGDSRTMSQQPGNFRNWE